MHALLFSCFPKILSPLAKPPFVHDVSGHVSRNDVTRGTTATREKSVAVAAAISREPGIWRQREQQQKQQRQLQP
jgi:hypothetical protein